jgi:hypothetical protein
LPALVIAAVFLASSLFPLQGEDVVFVPNTLHTGHTAMVSAHLPVSATTFFPVSVVLPVSATPPVSAVPQLLDHVLPAEKPTISGETARMCVQAPTTVSNPVCGNDTDTMILKEEYDSQRFTHDFFEYEQGQKQIIVRGRLKQHLDFWKNIGANDFI